MEFLFKIIFVALAATFAILLAGKQGIIERVQIHGNDFFSKMFNCQFCLSFWANVIVSLICFSITVVYGCVDYFYLSIPILATPITRKLL